MAITSHTQLRIFVSHSSKDNTFGGKLAEQLRVALGEEDAIWYDIQGGLHGGDAWWRKIVQQLTVSNTFIVVLSPDAMASPWVNDEIDLAWRLKNSAQRMRLVPVLHQACEVRADLHNLQIINFQAPRPFEAAFRELALALGLPASTPIPSSAETDTLGTTLARQMLPLIEASFAARDWTDVIRKTTFILKRSSALAPASIYRLRALALLEEGEREQAREAFEMALVVASEKEQRLAVLCSYTDMLILQSQWSEGLQLAKEALRLAPHDAAWTVLHQQMQQKAQSVALAPQKTKEQWLKEAEAHYDADRYEQAIAAYACVLVLDPSNVSAFYMRGEASLMLGDYKQAIVDENRALELDPDYKLAYGTRGDASLMLGDYKQAIVDASRAIELDPNYALAYRTRGEAYRMLGDDKQAIADANRTLELDPNCAKAYVTRGAAWLMQGDDKQTIANANRAIELDPNYALAYRTRGEAWRMQGDYKQAIADANRALKLDPNYKQAYYTRGAAYLLLGDDKQAIADANRALKLDPNYALAYFTRGEAYRMQGDYKQSIADTNRATELDPNYANAYATRGAAYCALKQYQQAIEDFDRALQLDPQYTWAKTQREIAVSALKQK
jgi:tetratricopeptide (TPR) repeat protein